MIDYYFSNSLNSKYRQQGNITQLNLVNVTKLLRAVTLSGQWLFSEISL